MNENEIARQLAAALGDDPNIIVGSVSGTLPDGTVNVLSGDKIVRAIATNYIPSGSNCLAVNDGSNWYAVGEASGQVVGERVMRSRKYRQRPKIQTTYPFKVLFSVVEDGVRKFYVGGDRQKPISIFTLSENFPYTAAITNLGDGKNDWVVGIRYYDLTDSGGDSDYRVKNIHGKLANGNWADNDELLRWRGAGFWTYDNYYQASANSSSLSIYRKLNLIKLTEDTHYSYSSFAPYQEIINNQRQEYGSNRLISGVRIYDPATSSNPLASFSGGGVGSINSIGSIHLPRATAFSIFPADSRGGFFRGIGFFADLEFTGANFFQGFNSSNTTYTYNIVISDKNTPGSGTYLIHRSGASQYDIFGFNIDEIASSTEAYEINLTLSYFCRARLPDGSTLSNTGGIVHYERTLSAGKARTPASFNSRKTSDRSRSIAFNIGGFAGGERGQLDSILLPTVSALTQSQAFLSNNSSVTPGFYGAYVNPPVQTIKSEENLTEIINTVVVSVDLKFALCLEDKRLSRSIQRGSDSTPIVVSENEINYWIYKADGSRFPVQFAKDSDKTAFIYSEPSVSTLWLNKKNDLEIYIAILNTEGNADKITAYAIYLTFSNNAYQVKFTEIDDDTHAYQTKAYKIFPVKPKTGELKFESASYFDSKNTTAKK